MAIDKMEMEFKLEAGLTKVVKEYLESLSDAKFTKMSDRYHPGVPDFVGCYKGHYVAIELKSATGKLSFHQMTYLSDIRNAGGKYVVATTLKQVVDLIESLD